MKAIPNRACSAPGATIIATYTTNFRGYRLHYENQSATESMLRAIDDFPSFFQPSGELPLIVDCGANIGVSMLEWKSRWPISRVICFEPDPYAFELLELNVDKNDIPGVSCVRAAVADFDGHATFHGDIGHGADGRGNSLSSCWGKRRESERIDVACKRLATSLPDEPIAFLKLDVEGVEESVLRDSKELLTRVEAAYIEVHETSESLDENSTARIDQLLRGAGFSTEIESKYAAHAFPPHLTSWQRQVGARQSQILCWRDE